MTLLYTAPSFVGLDHAEVWTETLTMELNSSAVSISIMHASAR